VPENIVVVKALISALILMSKNQFPQQFSKRLLFFCEVIVPHINKPIFLYLILKNIWLRFHVSYQETFSYLGIHSKRSQ
jgi:hypothetical protein